MIVLFCRLEKLLSRSDIVRADPAESAGEVENPYSIVILTLTVVLGEGSRNLKISRASPGQRG